jgi:hypothetical protein
MCIFKLLPITLVIFALWVDVAEVALADPPAAAGDAPVAGGQPLEAAMQDTIKAVIGGAATAAVQEKVQDAVSGTLQKASAEAMKKVTLVLRVSVIRRAKTGHSSAPKTGHHVGGTGWKNRLIRFRWQGA